MIISLEDNSDIDRLLVDKVFIGGEYRRGVVYIDLKGGFVEAYKFYNYSANPIIEKIYGKITVVFKDKTGNTAVITSDNFKNGRIVC